MKRLLSSFAFLLVATFAMAHDFEVDGIYYNITSSSEPYTVAVTYRGTSSTSYSDRYTGAVTIPETVTYDGKTYSVTTIGSSAFSNCESLTVVTIPYSVKVIDSHAFDQCRNLSVTVPDHVSEIGKDAFCGVKKIYVNRGTSSLIALWRSANYTIYTYDMEIYQTGTETPLPEPLLIATAATQTSITYKIEPWYDEYTYKYNDKYITTPEFTDNTLLPESYGDMLRVTMNKVNDTPYYDTYNIGTMTKPFVPIINTTASSVKTTLPDFQEGEITPIEIVVCRRVGPYTLREYGKYHEQKYYYQEFYSHVSNTGDYYYFYIPLSDTLSLVNRAVTFKGLDPGGYNNGAGYYMIYKLQNPISEKTLCKVFHVSIPTLTLTTQQPKVASAGNAIVCAETNLDEDEENVGFEWRKVDAPETVKSKQGNAIIYDGTMEGIIKNLATDSYYNVRPFYKSAAGNMYYGDWIGFDPADFSYFEPTVHTYADVAIVDGVATLVGYALQGTDDITEQGFEYWTVGEGAAKAFGAPTTGIQTVKATGQRMEATIKNLKDGTTYGFRAYAKTKSGTTYGEEREFTTPVADGIAEIPSEPTTTETKTRTISGIYTLQGVKVGDDASLLKTLPRGIYIVNGRKVAVK